MNAIQYSYDVPQNPEKEIEGIPTVEQAEEEYVPPPILDVPVDIAIVIILIILMRFCLSIVLFLAKDS